MSAPVAETLLLPPIKAKLCNDMRMHAIGLAF